MKSRRLNSQDRHLIVSGLLKQKFGHDNFYVWEREQKDRISKAWAKKVYDLLYPAPLRRKMKGFPKGFFVENDTIHLRSHSAGYRTTYLNLELPKDLPMAATDTRDYISITDERLKSVAGELKKEFSAIAETEKEWKAHVDKAKQCAAQFQTTKQLQEDWPEALKFLPPPPKPETKALIVAPKSINELFGITA